MINSITDYRREVLGIRFRGSSPKSSTESETSMIVFYADSLDYKLQKPMVDKILDLFKTSPVVLTDEPQDPFEALSLFTFGEKKAPNSIKAQDCFSFPSFSDISQNSDLKRELWEKLKKYT